MSPAPTTQSLDGAWSLELPDGRTAEVVVPGAWTTQVAGSAFADHAVTYRRTVDLAAPESGESLILAFGGVNHHATVRVNGQDAGAHTGGWTPFDIDVTELVTGGPTEIEVHVEYPQLGWGAGEPSINEVPHGKQTWYGTGAGIWQSVTLERRPVQHIERWSIRPVGATGQLRGSLRLSRPGDGVATVGLIVRDPAGATVAHTQVTPAAGARDVALEVEVDTPHLWSPSTPALYEVEVQVAHGDRMHADRRQTGFRDIVAVDGQILLNGHPLEIRGVLDQDYHPGSATIPESDEALRDLFQRAKDLGFNTLRCHIKRPDERYYRLADELGLLVWTELPSWTRMTDQAAERARALLDELIELDGHHPSIVIWTIMNESWGIELRDDAQRSWLLDTVDRVREMNPNTLIVDNSACEPNFHLDTDLDDYHVYRSIPEGRRAWDAKIDDFATRPDWTFSTYGDARRTGAEPLLLSEYGNWGLPRVTDQYENGAEPWWFATGAQWAFGAGDGRGLLERFRASVLAEIFGDWEALAAALQRAQMAANRYQTGSLRRRAELSGYVITQLSDVQWEANGLLDMNRAPKAGLDEFALMNQPAAVVIRPAAYAAETGAELALAIDTVPPRAGEPWSPRGALELSVLVDGETASRLPIDALEFASHSVSVRLPSAQGQSSIVVELRDAGELIARDRADIAVVAPRAAEVGRDVRFATDELARWGEGLGLTASTAAHDPAALFITTAFDRDAQVHASGGGRVLVIAETDDAFRDAFNQLPFGSLKRREGDGDWVPRVDWLRREGAFREIPGEPLLGIPFEDLLGEYVIADIPAPLRPAVVHSGVFAGWLQHAAATSLTLPWSRGEVTITTLRLRGATGLADEPLRAVVARAFVEHAGRG